MKILSAYIAGFGKFVKYNVDLSQNIVQIKEENGWGKTTFADFLECMFYGMDEGRKKSVADNFRVKYKPWKSETFGGTLTFISGEKVFRVERMFGKTPSFDVTKIYDERNIPVYVFGDKGERLGETLFGLDRESYRRSVYLPQGEITVDGFSLDIKGKLTALLTANDEKSGQKDAVTILDDAERALRSKRAPKTGKLDGIDAELLAIGERLRGVEESAQRAKQLYAQAEQEKTRLATLQTEWQAVEQKIAAYTQRKERAANATLQREWQAAAQDAETRLGQLAVFFGENEPSAINLQGLRSAIDEYAALKEKVDHLAEQERRLEELALEKEKASMERAVCEKSVETYQTLLRSQKKNKGEKVREEKAERKKAGKKGGYALIGVCLFLGVLFLGLMQVETQPVVGFAALGIGAVGALICMRSFWKNTLKANPKNGGFADKQLNASYKEALDALQAAQEQERALCEKEKEFSAQKAECEQHRTRLQALETAVQNFLAHFRFDKRYDYLSSAELIKRNVEEYVRYQQTLQNCKQKLAELPQVNEEEVSIDENEFARLKDYRARLEEEKTAAQKAQATYFTQAETYAKEGAKGNEYVEKRKRLEEEKARLEHRLTSIRTAKELIIRARENMALKYLVPVENACKRYAKALGFAGAEKWRFSASSTPLAEEDGTLKESEYYSAGMRGLWDFCIRLALVEALFTKEPPVLVLDDPLRDFDDVKTKQGKLLIKELSRRYQIVYCTCKEERKL